MISKQIAISYTFVTVLLISIVFFTGCATPVGVRKLDPKTVQRTLTANVLTNGNGEPVYSARFSIGFGLLEEFQSSVRHR